MREFRSRSDLAGALFCLYALLLGCADGVRASSSVPLQLEVSINGRAVGLIGSFVLTSDQRIAGTRQELDSLGIRVADVGTSAPIPLDELNGLTYSYDAARQAINIIASDDRLKPQEIGPLQPDRVTLSDSQLVGAVVNYGLTGSLYDDGNPGPTSARSWLPRQLQTLSLDTRVFGSLGTFAISGYLGSGVANQELFVRLDSTWSWSSADTHSTWRFGDVITRGPAWARPVRLGGAQLSTDFAARPDLVTAPLPAFRGSAAVPSTVDVFINNTKAYSQEVQPGPFVISNMPTITGAGSANIVVRDATGRETAQTVTFYNAPSLLRPSLFDYSVEAGFVRENYGIVSNDYDGRPVGSLSARYGLTDSVTLEGHAEVGAGLVNGGIGASFSLFDRSLWSLGGSLSNYDGATGALVYAAFQTNLGAASLHLSTQRTVGAYKDLPAVVQPDFVTTPYVASGPLNLAFDPPKALDTATVTFPLSGQGDNLSISMINRRTEEQSSRVLAGTYSRPLINDALMIVSGFHELETGNSTLFAGVSMPLGELGHAQVGLSRGGDQSGDHTEVAADYVKIASAEPGSVGWRISSNESDVSVRTAAATYQGSAARVEVGVEQIDDRVRGRATVDGAIVATSAGTFLSNRVTDSFAVVDVGAPDVDVLLDNRKVATTNSDGHALIPGLRSFQRNKISLDPDKLPPDATIPDVAAQVAPGDRAGVAVSLKAARTDNAAVVVFRAADGEFIAAGARGLLVDADKTFVVGYDGRAFIEGLAPHNAVTIDAGDKTCQASFAFAAVPGQQAVIDNVTCN